MVIVGAARLLPSALGLRACCADFLPVKTAVAEKALILGDEHELEKVTRHLRQRNPCELTGWHWQILGPRFQRAQ